MKNKMKNYRKSMRSKSLKNKVRFGNELVLFRKRSISTIPEPMMWDIARMFQPLCLAGETGISKHLFKVVD
jgi:hypothetical protein